MTKNINNLRLFRGLAGLMALSALPAAGFADTYVLRRDNVIPVVFESNLTIRDNRPGDSFRVRIGDTDQLPKGTELQGVIDRIHPASGRRPASMDLRFNRVLLPDHSQVMVDASPLPLDDKYITRTGDGRIVAKQDIRKQQNDVLGGAIGGFIVGSIFHRRITGTIIGTIVGVAAAQSDRDKDSNLIVKEGDRMGALINQTVTIDVGPPGPASRLDFNRRLDKAMDGPARDAEGSHYNILLTFHDKTLVFPNDALPYHVGKDIMVPLDPMAKQLSLNVDRHPDRTVNVDGRDSGIQLTISSREARLNGKRYDLSRTVVEHRGVLYVPLDALVPLLKDDLLLNGAKFVVN